MRFFANIKTRRKNLKSKNYPQAISGFFYFYESSLLHKVSNFKAMFFSSYLILLQVNSRYRNLLFNQQLKLVKLKKKYFFTQTILQRRPRFLRLNEYLFHYF